MRILLVHQNFPGQFCHLAHELSDMGHDVVALTDAANKQSDIVSTFRYSLTKPSIKSTQSSLAGPFSENTHRGEIAARAMVGLKENGFVPDLIIGHPGWGETLFCRDVFPRARLILHAEFYYGAGEADGSFDPEFQTDSLERAFRQRTLNATMLLAMVDADALVAPTRWQAGRFPALLQQKIHIAHEGIDTRLAVPNGAATLTLQRQGLTIKAGDEIVTFVSRNLEPYRGYHIFMRALPRILSERPNARAVIVGADGVSYGAAPGNGKSWKAIFRNEVGDMLPMDRVHFVGRIPHDSLITLFQISAAHVYLTYPFVLSWSILEAMSAGCIVVGSRTPPVEEIIINGENGLLVDFHRPDELATGVIDVLTRPDTYAPLRIAARNSIVAAYDLKSRCIGLWLDVIASVMK